jgi:hypothetical protein
MGCVLIPSDKGKENIMSSRIDLVGKTISGVVATPVCEGGPLKIWMLQFSDGSHVEFVSPGARRALGKLTGQRRRGAVGTDASAQMALNVA